MTESTQNIIDLRGLKIGFRVRGRLSRPVSGPLNTSLVNGELVALMGINGSGKSTLLRTLSGLQKQLGGAIQIMGRDLGDYSGRELAKILAYVSTEVVSVQGMQVKQLVAMGRYPYTNWFGVMTSEDQEKVEHALELTSLKPLGERDMDELSDGERQRAMIARTLAQDTPILMLDEPTAFLDLSHRYEIIHLLRTLTRDHQRTILFSTHDLQIALREADKIWLMNGQEIMEGAPEDLVLTGKLSDALLEGTSAIDVSLDMESGEFRLRKDNQAVASVSAPDKNLERWTCRALERIGFNTESKQSGGIDVIVSKKYGKLIWTVEKKGHRVELNSIYKLSLYLRTMYLTKQSNHEHIN